MKTKSSSHQNPRNVQSHCVQTNFSPKRSALKFRTVDCRCFENFIHKNLYIIGFSSFNLDFICSYIGISSENFLVSVRARIPPVFLFVFVFDLCSVCLVIYKSWHLFTFCFMTSINLSLTISMSLSLSLTQCARQRAHILNRFR